ncbi:MAG: YkgJ family cysteine cluster protein [Planctomycetaceae bacterium]|nr:YkgJ family cysteine cluster protein [Planctomycetaceae bacterium]
MGITPDAPASDDSLCRRCARTGPTCCQRTQVYVTGGDIARIAAATGLIDFHETVPPADPSGGGTLHLDAAWAGTFSEAGSTVLAHAGNGDCVVLVPDGCRLPLAVRPLVCRLYPFDYNEDCIKGVFAPLCPAPERDAPALLLAELAMNRSAAEAWRRRLYDELREEAGKR